MTIGFFPPSLRPAAIEQATASLALGTYSIFGLLIDSLIRFFAKLQGTTHKCEYPFCINPSTNFFVFPK